MNAYVGQTYGWDTLGNLTDRQSIYGPSGSVNAVLTENFGYDTVNRLTSYSNASIGNTSVANSPILADNVTLAYNPIGNILSKSNVGLYHYPASGTNAVRPSALTGITPIAGAAMATNRSHAYDANGNLVAAWGAAYAQISYNSFNTTNGKSGAANITYEWRYGVDHERVRETKTALGVTRNTYYFHANNQGSLSFEQEQKLDPLQGGTQFTNRIYVSGGHGMGGQAVAMLETTGSITANPSQAATVALVQYWHHDHLGSTVAVTDGSGALRSRYSYDPFGKRREVWGQYDEFGTLVFDHGQANRYATDRGFTGHEHLDDIGIIHMNGRLFDPLTGRFLQADPFIEDPTHLQSFNRYGYVSNNPLNATDPSGYFSLRKFLRAAAIAVAVYAPGFFATHGIAVAGMSYGTAMAINVAIAGGISGYISTGTANGALQGAFSAALFYGVGEFVPGNPGDLGKVAGHAAAGCISSAASGGSCRSGALASAFSEAVGHLIGNKGDHVAVATAKRMILGGTASVIGGGKFENGATSAAFGYLFNECMHTRMCGSDSTRVTVSGNRVAPLLDFAHSEIQISNGYDFVVLEGQPGYSNGNGRLEGRSNGANMGDAFTFDLAPTDGRTMTQFANDLRAAAGSYRDNLLYSFPSPRFGFNNLNGGYNSNSYVGGVLDAAAPGSGLRYAVQGAAARQGFRVPGMENPIPLRPVGP